MAISRGGLRGVNRALALAFGLLVFGFLAICLEARSAIAQDWMFESSLSQRMGYNSNLLLRPDNEISTFSSRTTPAFTLSRAGPTSDISLEGRFEFNQYIDHSDLNSDDQFAKLEANKALSERSKLGFEGNFRRDTTTDTDDDDNDQFVVNQIRYIRWDVSPSWEYLLSPIDRMKLSARYEQSDYDSNEKTDFRNYGPSATYTHDLSELAAVFGQVDFSRFEPEDDVDTVQDVYGGLLGYNYHPTERFTISAAARLNYNITESHEQKSEGEIGYRFQLNMNYQINDQTNATLTLSRDTEPTGDGEARTRNRGNFNISYRMTEMTVFALDGSYIDDQRTQSNSDVSRRVQVKPSVTWDITEDLSLQAAYQFRYKTFEDSGSAFDNGAFLTLRYALPDFNWSGF
jgi:hypothetical protein